jgi:hypothetical protein
MNTKLLRVATQKDLKESIWGMKTVVQLEKITDNVLNALNNTPFDNVAISKNKITFDLKDPQNENPIIIRTIVNAGGCIQYVTQFDPSLEDTFLEFLRQENEC